MTPLHLAAERGRYKTIVVDLVKLGAEVDIRDVNEVNTIIAGSIAAGLNCS